MPHKGHAVPYYLEGDAGSYPAIITTVYGPERIDVVYAEDDKTLILVEKAYWIKGAAYGQPPAGGGG